MPHETVSERLIEDVCVPTIFYDGLAAMEARAGVLRMVAFQQKRDEKTGRTVRVPVAVFIRPIEATATIHKAVKAACVQPITLQLAH